MINIRQTKEIDRENREDDQQRRWSKKIYSPPPITITIAITGVWGPYFGEISEIDEISELRKKNTMKFRKIVPIPLASHPPEEFGMDASELPNELLAACEEPRDMWLLFIINKQISL